MAALSALLGDEEWFFGADRPGLFDASVFAYTYLLFGGLEWPEKSLQERLRRWRNLVEHKERIAARCYPDSEAV